MGLKEELLERKRELEEQLQEINTALSGFGVVGVENVPIKSNIVANHVVDNKKKYGPKQNTWAEQIAIVIKTEDRFLHNNEIAEAIAPYFPDKTLHDVKRRVSAVLSDAVRNNKIKGLCNYNFSKSNQDWVWGKEDWLDENGKIKKEYQFNEREKKGSKGPIEL